MLSILTSCSLNPSQGIRNRYLGQEPPGLTPERFAPEIISDPYRNHGFPTFSPDGKEILWPILPPKIMYIKYENGIWTAPEVAAFSERNAQSPFYHCDGKSLFYQVSHEGGYGSLDIWYVTKSDTGWSRPFNVGPPVNTMRLESQPSLTESGTLYYSGTLEGSGFDRGIYRSRWTDGKYEQPELLPKPINTEYIDTYPFIAKDESYLLFCSSRPSVKEEHFRIYITFRDKDDSWSEPINLSEKLGIEQSRYPSVSPNGRFLFYQSDDDIYWVDSQILSTLKGVM